MGKSSRTTGVIRAVAFTTIVTVIVLTNNETYSSFLKSMQEQLQVSSASAENLVSNVEILEQQDGSLLIQITRDSEYGYRPDVGFVIEGELANYILHINPVTIDTNGIYEIPIEPNINTYQFLDLLRMKYSQEESYIPGVVTVKNFDGKIIDSKEIEISIDYLLSKIAYPFERSNVNELHYNKSDDFEIENVTKLITNIIGQYKWDDEMMYTTEMVPTDTLTPYQMEIIHTIAPSLLDNVNALYNERDIMRQENAELKLIIENLTIELEELKNREPVTPEVNVPGNQEPEEVEIEIPEDQVPEEQETEVPENQDAAKPGIEDPVNPETNNDEP